MSPPSTLKSLSVPYQNSDEYIALRRLKEIMRGPETPEQDIQILKLLKSNPGLMSSSIRLRT